MARVATLAVVLVVAGCGGGSDLSAEDAPAQLGPVVDVVADALVSDLGASAATPAAGSLAPGEDDSCYYRSQTYTFPELLGVDIPLAEVRDAIAAALATEDGWELLDEEDIPGGFVGVDAEGPGDARLELRTRTESELRIVAQLDGTCDRKELPLP